MLESVESKEKIQKQIIRTWITGQNSCTLIVPRDFARQYQMDEPSHVVVEGRPEGILIRKLEL
jgi:hypothetical protein